jgi:hypothetical protein
MIINPINNRAQVDKKYCILKYTPQIMEDIGRNNIFAR